MLASDKVSAGRGLRNFFFMLFSTKMIISINIIKIVALTQWTYFMSVLICESTYEYTPVSVRIT